MTMMRNKKRVRTLSIRVALGMLVAFVLTTAMAPLTGAPMVQTAHAVEFIDGTVDDIMLFASSDFISPCRSHTETNARIACVVSYLKPTNKKIDGEFRHLQIVRDEGKHEDYDEEIEDADLQRVSDFINGRAVGTVPATPPTNASEAALYTVSKLRNIFDGDEGRLHTAETALEACEDVGGNLQDDAQVNAYAQCLSDKSEEIVPADRAAFQASLNAAQSARHGETSRSEIERAGQTSRGGWSTFGNFVAYFFNMLVGLFIGILLTLMNLELTLVSWALSQANAVNTPWIVSTWKALRDFVNIAFILVLLGIAVMNILQVEMDKYAVKTMLPKMIFAVLAVNFSRLICGLILDFANVVEAGVWSIGGMGPNGSGMEGTLCSNAPTVFSTEGSITCRLASTFKLDNFDQVSKQGASANADVSQWDLLLLNVIMFFLLIFMVIGLIAVIIMFIARTIILWALIITSPIMFAGSVIPGADTYATQWKEKFFKYAFMHVIFAAYMVIAVRAVEGFVGDTTSELGSNVFFQDTSLMPPELDTNNILRIIFMVGLLYAAVFTAVKEDVTSSVTGKLQGWANSFGQWAGASSVKYLRVIPGLQNPFRDEQGNATLRRPFSGFYRGIDVAYGVHELLESGKQKVRASAETRSSPLARGLSSFVPNRMFGGDDFRERLHQVQTASQKKNANEEAEGLTARSTVDLRLMLAQADTESKMRAIVMTLAKRGDLEWTLLGDSLAQAGRLQDHDGNVIGENAYGAMSATDRERAVKDHFGHQLHDTEFGREMTELQRSALRKSKEGGEYWLEANSYEGRPIDYVMEQADRMALGQAIGGINFMMDKGKGRNSDEIAGLLTMLLNDDVIGQSMLKEMSNDKSYTLPIVDYLMKLRHGKMMTTLGGDNRDEVEFIGEQMRNYHEAGRNLADNDRTDEQHEADRALRMQSIRELRHWMVEYAEADGSTRDRLNKSIGNTMYKSMDPDINNDTGYALSEVVKLRKKDSSGKGISDKRVANALFEGIFKLASTTSTARQTHLLRNGAGFVFSSLGLGQSGVTEAGFDKAQNFDIIDKETQLSRENGAVNYGKYTYTNANGISQDHNVLNIFDGQLLVRRALNQYQALGGGEAGARAAQQFSLNASRILEEELPQAFQAIAAAAEADGREINEAEIDNLRQEYMRRALGGIDAGTWDRLNDSNTQEERTNALFAVQVQDGRGAFRNVDQVIRPDRANTTPIPPPP